MSRIDLNDSVFDIVFKMSEGNPGAINVMMRIIDQNKKIDPQNGMGSIGTILMFDTFGIYGPRIWMLYKDVCKESIAKTIACIRGVQLGIIEPNVLSFAIDNYGKGVDVDDVISKVCKELKDFNISE